MPRVSVIIPAYNRADLISESIESVLAQTYRDFEIVLVNDGSTDNTLEILSKYEANNVRIINQRNQGEGIARNVGIKASKGDLISFLDSDDLWLPSKLARQVELFDANPSLAWCYSDAMCFLSKTIQDLYPFSYRNRPYEGQVAKYLLLRCFIPILTVVVRSTIFEEVGLFCDLPKAADWDLWLRIAARYPVSRVPEVLARYRMHEGNISGSQAIAFQYQCYVKVIERAVAFATESYGKFQKKALAIRALEAGQSYLLKGSMDEGRKMFTEAVHYHSGSPAPYFWWLLTLGGRTLVNKIFEIIRMIRRAM